MKTVKEARPFLPPSAPKHATQANSPRGGEARSMWADVPEGDPGQPFQNAEVKTQALQSEIPEFDSYLHLSPAVRCRRRQLPDDHLENHAGHSHKAVLRSHAA